MKIIKKKGFIRHSTFAKRKLSAGFTLIELLVVISIIGLLSSVVLTSLNDARAKARDAQRVSDIGQIRLALQLYYEDNENYPRVENDEVYSGEARWNTNTNSLYVALVGGGYLPSLPVDPINSTNLNYLDANNYNYVYETYSPNTYLTNYDLAARLEKGGHPISCEIKGSYVMYTYFPWDWCVNSAGPNKMFADH